MMRVTLGFMVVLVLWCLGAHKVVQDHRDALQAALAEAHPAPMSLSEMTAHATDLTGRLMECFGESGDRERQGAAQCRPVVVCVDGGCHLAREPAWSR